MPESSDVTLLLYGTQVDRVRKALGQHYGSLDKTKKRENEDGVSTESTAKAMEEVEAIMRALEPQLDLVDAIERPPEAY